MYYLPEWRLVGSEELELYSFYGILDTKIPTLFAYLQTRKLFGKQPHILPTYWIQILYLRHDIVQKQILHKFTFWIFIHFTPQNNNLPLSTFSMCYETQTITCTLYTFYLTYFTLNALYIYEHFTNITIQLQNTIWNEYDVV